MNKIILAAITGALAILATPASAGQQHGYGHGHGHASYSHSSYRHVSHHSHHSYHKPVHYAHHTYQPSYHTPHYVKPVVYVEPTTTYVKRPAYVYEKVAGYCTDVIKTYGYQQHRKTVECKAGEYQKPEAKVAIVEPAPAPEQAPEAPQK